MVKHQIQSESSLEQCLTLKHIFPIKNSALKAEFFIISCQYYYRVTQIFPAFGIAVSAAAAVAHTVTCLIAF